MYMYVCMHVLACTCMCACMCLHVHVCVLHVGGYVVGPLGFRVVVSSRFELGKPSAKHCTGASKDL